MVFAQTMTRTSVPQTAQRLGMSSHIGNVTPLLPLRPARAARMAVIPQARGKLDPVRTLVELFAPGPCLHPSPVVLHRGPTTNDLMRPHCSALWGRAIVRRASCRQPSGTCRLTVDVILRFEALHDSGALQCS